MKNSQLHKALEVAHKANLSVFIKGAPGTGKTEGVRQYAAKKGLKLIAIHAPLSDLLDLKGVISTNEDSAKFLPLSLWPKETDEPVVVLIDELPQCVPAIQNGYSQLLIDKVMGDVKLPEGSLVIATGNRREDKAATHNVPSQIINRVMHIDITHDVEDFFDWGLANGVSPEVIAFGRFRPGVIHNFDASNSQEPYGTFRSWKYVSDVLKSNPPEDLLFELVSGLVGKGGASEFIAYLRVYRSLPDPKVILKDPMAYTIPTDPGVMFALVAALAHYVSKDTADAFYDFALRLDAEWSVSLVKSAKLVFPEITKAKAFSKWAKEHSKFILPD